MKIIITGCTGQIGKATLERAISTPAISRIYTVTRRPLGSTSEKVKNIVHEDFSTFPDHLVDQLVVAECCIWSVGLTPSKGTTKEQFYDTDVVPVKAASRAFVDKLQPKLGGKKFRFVYVSAWVAERDQSKPLWLMPIPRRSKGQTEQTLVDLATERPEALEVFAARPGGVVSNQNILPNFLIWSIYASRDEQIAAALVDVALNGYATEVIHARTLHEHGAEVLAK